MGRRAELRVRSVVVMPIVTSAFFPSFDASSYADADNFRSSTLNHRSRRTETSSLSPETDRGCGNQR